MKVILQEKETSLPDKVLGRELLECVAPILIVDLGITGNLGGCGEGPTGTAHTLVEMGEVSQVG